MECGCVEVMIFREAAALARSEVGDFGPGVELAGRLAARGFLNELWSGEAVQRGYLRWVEWTGRWIAARRERASVFQML